ncbi:hypothetical protein [Salimicrobium flavidum]|uniref:Uncharacterized protein n=1 Tax=Salimicrobium flavidum TaxID=570947 RepID=A0A1N7J7M2_9BACI|nr:hypothetical protein [Salimicrobium flavidum]SIS45251.1 hypothetical protein SAMN05421687_10473 [Salimicrobium flavidum]
MKRTFAYGIGSLLIVSLVAFINVSIFLSIISVVSALCIGASGLLLRTMIGVGPWSAGMTSEGTEDKKDKRLGVHIGIFGLPYLVTTVLFLV